MPAKKSPKKSIKQVKTTKSPKKARTKAPRVVAKAETPKPTPKELVDCKHCETTGKCAAGEPYDKGHHQDLFRQVRLTSCVECLEAAGESRNSKKMVVCRVCHGTGKVERTQDAGHAGPGQE